MALAINCRIFVVFYIHKSGEERGKFDMGNLAMRERWMRAELR